MNAEDDLVVLLPSYDVSFSSVDEALYFDGVDRDVSFDDAMGGIPLGVGDFRTLAGCGVQWLVLPDADMDAMETRIRMIAVEIERR